MQVIADFLTERFQAGLQSATVRNYKSAIQAVHLGFLDGTSLADADCIRQRLNDMYNRRPPERSLVPAWDLNTVLEYLKGPPFEPFASASLLDLTRKTLIWWPLLRAADVQSFTRLPWVNSLDWRERGRRCIFALVLLSRMSDRIFRPLLSSFLIFLLDHQYMKIVCGARTGHYGTS